MTNRKTKTAPAPDSKAETAAVEAAVGRLHRLQESRLLVEAKLARHTGLFGSGLFKMSDPENEKLLNEIKGQIDVQLRYVEESRAVLQSLEDAILKSKAVPAKQAGKRRAKN